MADPTPVQYFRLPGSGRSRKGGSFITLARVSCRLWLGDDHLLQVESSGGYSENYKRFYFRDIQAIFLQKTRSWLITNVVLGIFTGLFLLWMLLIKDQAGVITLGILASVLFVFLLVNLAQGATCLCHLKTAVHLEELPSLRRRRNALKVLARLKPLLELAQGAAAAGTLAQEYAELLARANAAPATPGHLSRLADPEIHAYQGRFHQILFSTLLVDAFADTLNIFWPGLPVVLLGALCGAALAGAVLIALVKQHQTDLKAMVRVVTWITSGFVGLGYVTGYVIMIVTLPAQGPAAGQWGFFKGIAALQPFETPWWLAVLSVNAAVALLLGIAGLLGLRQHWREKAAAS